MAERTWSVYLSGEIHSDWRERIEAGVREAGLPVAFSAPVTDHALKESTAPPTPPRARQSRSSTCSAT